MDEKTAAAAAAEIESILEGQAEMGLTFDLDKICELYRKLKGPLEKVLPWIEKIPTFGTSAALVIRLLMKLADHFCPIK